jgi:SnoaL-like domain
MSLQPDPAALQAVIDKMEIGEMQSRYMYALDRHEADVYASMFTDDAVLEWPEGNAKGREAIHNACVRIGQFYDKLAAAAGPRKPFRLRHYCQVAGRPSTLAGFSLNILFRSASP